MMIFRPVRPCVPHRAADLEPAGGVDQQPVVRAVQLQCRDDRLDHAFLDVGMQQRLQVDRGRVLGGDDDRVEPDRLVADVLDRHLGLAVRPDVGDFTVLADLGQPPGQPVRERDRQRHQLGRLLARVAEHQPLVTGTLPVELVVAFAFAVLVGTGDALGDVR